MSKQDNIQGAINRSISHNEIVTVDVEDIDAAMAALTEGLDCEYDYVDTQGGRECDQTLREVWSTTGEEWRVHLLQAH